MSVGTDPLIQQFQETLSNLAGAPEEDVLATAMNSPAVHFALFCRIRNKRNELQHPTPNVLQLRMSQAYETLKSLGVKIRIIAVKPRQTGCSQFASHIVYHFGMNEPIQGISISDIKAHSSELMAKVGEYSIHDSFPWGVQQTQDAAHSLAWSNGTSWTIDTAENPDAGVGGTRQAAHFSEVAKWPQNTTRNDMKTMAAVLPSLSGDRTLVIAESTPEGAKGWHYQTWQEAVTLEDFVKQWNAGFRPDAQWIKIFSAWFEFTEHRRKEPLSSQELEQIEDTLDETEVEGIRRWGWDMQQIAWRRDTIKSDCGGDPKVFLYYFPSDDVSCWLASGSPRFDMQAVIAMERAAKMETPETGYLLSQDDKQVTWQSQRDGTGDIVIWERPKAGLSYLVALDPATNESQTVGKDPDRHSLSVWRRGYHDQLSNRWKPAKRVARLRPPFFGEDEDVAGHAIRLSRYYGHAICAMEVNIGQGIMRLLQLAGVGLYKRKVWSPKVGSNVEQYGFKMSSEKDVREGLFSGLASAIRNGDIDPSCPHAVGEYKTFVRNDKGKSEAASGYHDDDVCADAIAWETLPSASPFKKEMAIHLDPPDRNSWRSARW